MQSVNGKVMIITEDADMGAKSEAAVKAAGYQVVRFSDPWVALRYLRIEQSHVLVVDQDMLAMDSRDFFARAAKVAPNSLRILLTTFETLDKPIHGLHPYNVFRFLAKPCYESSLVRAVGTGMELVMLKASFRPNAKPGQFELHFPANALL